MAEHHTSYVLDLKGNIDAKARRYSRSMKRFSRNGQRSMSRFGRAVHGAGRALDKMGNRYVGLMTGGAAFATGRYLTKHQDRLVRLGISAQISKEKIDDLNRKIYETAQLPNIRINPSELTSAVEAIVEKTGDIQFATDNLKNLALTIQATGSSGTDVGKMAAEMEKIGITGSNKLLKAVDVLNMQSVSGALKLKDLAALAPQVLTAYDAVTHSARGPIKTIRELGAAMQMIKRGVKSAEEAGTAFDALISDLTNPKKLAKLHKQLHIQVFDPEALRQGKKVLRPINELMVEIQKKSHGDRTILGQIFGETSIRAFNSIDPKLMSSLYGVHATGQKTIEESARAAKTMASSLTSLQTALKRFADAKLADDIQAVADAINSIDPDTLNKMLKVLAGGAVGFGGLLLGRKLYKGGRAVAGLLGRAGGKIGMGSGRGAGAAGGTLGGFADVQKVYVVNWEGRGARGGTGGPGGRGAAGESRGRASRGGVSTTRRTPTVAKRLKNNGVGKPIRLGRLGLVSSALETQQAYARAHPDAERQMFTISDIAGWVKGWFDNDDSAPRNEKAARDTQQDNALQPWFKQLLLDVPQQQTAQDMQRAAHRMERAAARMENTDVHITIETDNNGNPRVRYVAPSASVDVPYARDPYNGPMMAGG